MSSLIPQAESPNHNTIPEPSFITKIFTTGFFSGYSPFAPGTVGSAVALAIYTIPGFESLYIIIVVTLVVFILGIRATNIMEKRYGHDPSEVTIDEFVGMWISLILLPKKLVVSLAAFFIFRFFDIVKPFPARRFDTVHGGIGIMMDDVIAGIYTNIVIQVLLLIPWTAAHVH